MAAIRTVEVRDGLMVISQERRVDLIDHVYRPAGDRALLREVVGRVLELERGGA